MSDSDDGLDELLDAADEAAAPPAAAPATSLPPSAAHHLPPRPPPAEATPSTQPTAKDAARSFAKAFATPINAAAGASASGGDGACPAGAPSVSNAASRQAGDGASSRAPSASAGSSGASTAAANLASSAPRQPAAPPKAIDLGLEEFSGIRIEPKKRKTTRDALKVSRCRRGWRPRHLVARASRAPPTHHVCLRPPPASANGVWLGLRFNLQAGDDAQDTRGGGRLVHDRRLRAQVRRSREGGGCASPPPHPRLFDVRSEVKVTKSETPKQFIIWEVADLKGNEISFILWDAMMSTQARLYRRRGRGGRPP